MVASIFCENSRTIDEAGLEQQTGRSRRLDRSPSYRWIDRLLAVPMQLLIMKYHVYVCVRVRRWEPHKIKRKTTGLIVS